MNEDPAARAVLESTVVEWREQGLIEPLRTLVGEVWRADLDRHETILGDDAITLGITASRNICNLAVQKFRHMPGVVARDVRTLEIRHRGRVLNIGKVTSTSLAWPVEAMTWDRDVRRSAADANSKVYVSQAGTLWEGVKSPATVARGDAASLCHLFLCWQGFKDGRTRAWVGFPSAERYRPWFAVLRLDDNPGDNGGIPAGDDHPVPPNDTNFDDLGEPELRPSIRRDQGERHHPDSA